MNAYLKSVLLPAVVGILVLAGPAPAAPEEAEAFPLRFLHDGPYELGVHEGKLRAVMPFEYVDPRKAAETRVVIAYVRCDGLDSQRLLGACAPLAIDNGTNGRPSTLTIAIDTREVSLVRRHGTYRVALRATVPAEKVEPPPEEPVLPVWKHLEIELARTKSVAASVQQITIWRDKIIEWPLDGNDGHFHLKINSGPMPEHLTAYQSGPAAIDGKNVDGRLALTIGPTPEGSAAIPIAVTVAEQFPSGDAGGNIRIESPDIEPQTVHYTVKTRQHWGLLFLVAFVGLSLGHLARVVLVRRIDVGRLRLQLGVVYAAVRAKQSEIQHADFQMAVGELDDELRDLLSKIRHFPDQAAVDEVEAAVPKIQERLDTAVNQAEEARGKLAEDLAAAGKLLESGWEVPAEFEGAIAAARNVIADVPYNLARQDLDRAAKSLEKGIGPLANRLSELWSTWMAGATTGLDGVEKLRAKLPEDAIDWMSRELPKVREKLARERPAADADAAVRAQAYLDLVHHASGTTSLFLLQLLASVRHEVAAVSDELAAAGDDLPKKAVLQDLEAVLADLKPEEATAAVDSPGSALERIQRVLAGAARAMRVSVEIEFSDGKVPGEVKTALGEGRYADAAALAVKCGFKSEKATVAGGAGQVFGARATKRQRGDQASTDTRDAKVGRGDAHDWPLGRAPRLIVDPVRTTKEIFKAQRAQFLIAAVLLAVVAVLIFRPSFVGTLTEFAVVFFWGFTTDIGVSVLLDKVKTGGLSAPPT